jgi:hypothetical protein
MVGFGDAGEELAGGPGRVLGGAALGSGRVAQPAASAARPHTAANASETLLILEGPTPGQLIRGTDATVGPPGRSRRPSGDAAGVRQRAAVAAAVDGQRLPVIVAEQFIPDFLSGPGSS